MARPKGVTVTIDRVDEVVRSIKALEKLELMIGIPAEKAPRSGGPINNATLAYIHEHGAPEANIPARPFLRPTIEENQESMINPEMLKAGKASFQGDANKAQVILGRLGQRLADAVRNKILSHIPPPLKPGTVLRRTTRLAKYKTASAKRKRTMRAAATTPAALADAVPLWDTGQMARSVTWVLRKKK